MTSRPHHLTGGPAATRRPAAVLAGLLAALVAVLGLGLGALAGPAAADDYPPTAGCTVSTTTANAGPGSAVTFVGSGFQAGQTVSLSVPALSAALGTVTTTAKGTFSGTFTWPASVNGPSAQVQASTPSATCSFTLVNHRTAAATGGTGDPTTGSGLSHTGFQTLAATVIAVGLIGAGAVFLGLSRRPRS